MRPARNLLRLLGAWTLCALLLLILHLLQAPSATVVASIWWSAGALLAAVAAIDAGRRDALRQIECTRQLPESFAVGVKNSAALHFVNRAAYPIALDVMEDHPTHCLVQGLPSALTLPAHGAATLHYQCIPQRRGDAELGRPWLRIASRWRLWQFRLRPDIAARMRVFPNFSALAYFSGLDFSRQMGAIGVHQLQRRGEGLDFHQLRFFREGDALRQIDWKATARYQKPISREYQEERDQDIIFLLDCGRRMRAKAGELSHFDHALNALLLTSHVALRQGDAVGLLTFAGTARWVAPLKGRSAIHHLLQRVYDLHSSVATSDFLEAAQKILIRQKKRALIVVLSTLHEEDETDLRAAIALLNKRHLVIVANLREQALEQQLQHDIHTLDDALLHAGIRDYIATRQRLTQLLRHGGMHLLDSLPQQLHIDLVEQYWRMKRGGLI